jgi:hypothetical protein
MARSYYSAVLDHTAEDVWAVIRPFDHYRWAVADAETIIEDGKVGDQVGAIRRVTMGERVIRQVLLGHSDAHRAYSYAFVGKPPFPVRDFTATLRVKPLVETAKAFVEWWATFDCAADERDHWTLYFERQGFALWLLALRRFMATRAG